MCDVKILNCTCKSVFQDKEYGASKRVMNPTAKENKTKSQTGGKIFRCTVCSKEVKI